MPAHFRTRFATDGNHTAEGIAWRPVDGLAELALSGGLPPRCPRPIRLPPDLPRVGVEVLPTRVELRAYLPTRVTVRTDSGQTLDEVQAPDELSWHGQSRLDLTPHRGLREGVCIGLRRPSLHSAKAVGMQCAGTFLRVGVQGTAPAPLDVAVLDANGERLLLRHHTRLHGPKDACQLRLDLHRVRWLVVVLDPATGELVRHAYVERGRIERPAPRRYTLLAPRLHAALQSAGIAFCGRPPTTGWPSWVERELSTIQRRLDEAGLPHDFEHPDRWQVAWWLAILTTSGLLGGPQLRALQARLSSERDPTAWLREAQPRLLERLRNVSSQLADSMVSRLWYDELNALLKHAGLDRGAPLQRLQMLAKLPLQAVRHLHLNPALEPTDREQVRRLAEPTATTRAHLEQDPAMARLLEEVGQARPVLEELCGRYLGLARALAFSGLSNDQLARASLRDRLRLAHGVQAFLRTVPPWSDPESHLQDALAFDVNAPRGSVHTLRQAIARFQPFLAGR